MDIDMDDLDNLDNIPDLTLGKGTESMDDLVSPPLKQQCSSTSDIHVPERKQTLGGLSNVKEEEEEKEEEPGISLASLNPAPHKPGLALLDDPGDLEDFEDGMDMDLDDIPGLGNLGSLS